MAPPRDDNRPGQLRRGRRRGVLPVPSGTARCRLKVTERKFLDNPTGQTTAYQMQRHYVVITEPEKDYTFLATTTASGNRDFPFGNIKIPRRW